MMNQSFKESIWTNPQSQIEKRSIIPSLPYSTSAFYLCIRASIITFFMLPFTRGPFNPNIYNLHLLYIYPYSHFTFLTDGRE